MHYYQFNIGDYHSHTSHLEPLEDLAYRRMMDWCYLHESPLPLDVDEIAKLIRMRSHSDCIAYVLRVFFKRNADGYINERILNEIAKFNHKSLAAKRSADARWHGKQTRVDTGVDANALRTHCEGNANHKPITNNHKPIEKKESLRDSKEKTTSRFAAPTLDEVLEKCQNKHEGEKFWNYYQSNGWRVGKNQMKSWPHALAGWIKRASEYGNQNKPPQGDWLAACQLNESSKRNAGVIDVGQLNSLENF